MKKLGQLIFDGFPVNCGVYILLLLSIGVGGRIIAVRMMSIGIEIVKYIVLAAGIAVLKYLFRRVYSYYYGHCIGYPTCEIRDDAWL